jgi:hypothetical protein
MLTVVMLITVTAMTSTKTIVLMIMPEIRTTMIILLPMGAVIMMLVNITTTEMARLRILWH